MILRSYSLHTIESPSATTPYVNCYPPMPWCSYQTWPGSLDYVFLDLAGDQTMHALPSLLNNLFMHAIKCMNILTFMNVNQRCVHALINFMWIRYRHEFKGEILCGIFIQLIFIYIHCNADCPIVALKDQWSELSIWRLKIYWNKNVWKWYLTVTKACSSKIILPF